MGTATPSGKAEKSVSVVPVMAFTVREQLWPGSRGHTRSSTGLLCAAVLNSQSSFVDCALSLLSNFPTQLWAHSLLSDKFFSV